jgi:fused signal recognition particle receptor
MVFGIFKSGIDGLRRGLSKTAGAFRRLFGKKLTEEAIEELEEAMVTADMGPALAAEFTDFIKESYRKGEITEMSQVFDRLRAELKSVLTEKDNSLILNPDGLTVIMVAGVNGTGKTTSIAKLAKMFTEDGRKVLLSASDTFRAAACEQLALWSGRVGCDIVKHQTGADPAAVTFDAIDAALARGANVLIVDTAGRLHTETNLMKELGKIRRVVEKKIPGAPHEVLLVLDATTGQNAISQAREFKDVIDVTGLVLAKLDGTAKGGIIVAIKRQLDIPVKFVGIGEQINDLEVFNAERFVEALFD